MEREGAGRLALRYAGEREQPGERAASSGRYKEAERLYRRDLEGCEKELSQGHPDTLSCLQFGVPFAPADAV